MFTVLMAYSTPLILAGLLGVVLVLREIINHKPPGE